MKILNLIEAGYIKEAQTKVQAEAVSTKMVQIVNDIINDINNNGTHLQKLKTVGFISFSSFKNNLKLKKKRTILEDWVLGIKSVELQIPDLDLDKEQYIIHHKLGDMYLPFYDLSLARYRKQRPKYDKNSGHLRFLVERGSSQTSVTYERLMMLADAIYKDYIPDRVRGLQCNVKDCTGNPDTAKRLGLNQSFAPNNLEWCFDKDNSSHYNMCMKSFDWSGRPWIVSALDIYLYELTQSGTKDEVVQYLDWFCMPA